jgi:transposase
VIADKGYDSDIFRQFIESEGMESVIPKRKYNGEKQKGVDWCLYKYRHLVENAFGRIKYFRSISTRYEKLARNCASMVSLAFMMMRLPMYC